LRRKITIMKYLTMNHNLFVNVRTLVKMCYIYCLLNISDSGFFKVNLVLW